MSENNTIKASDESFDDISVEISDKQTDEKKIKKIKNKNKKLNRTKKPLAWRKFVIIGSFIALFIVVVFASYITTYTKTKITPFSNSTSIKESKIKDFDIDFYCKQYGEPDKDNESRDIIFELKVSNIDTSYSYSSLKWNVCIGDEHWTNRKKTGSASTVFSTYTSYSTTESYTKTLTISEYEYSYPVRKMVFVNIKHPTVWLNLTYTKTTTSGTSTSYSYVIEYNWNNYFRSGTTVII